ncbi:MAG: DUF2520 domain-containing protein [Bacteroidota bacterium]|nr:DUF2520 domain-containing protein [Bacteroidota bacterium]
MPSTKFNISIVGAGRVGSAMSSLLFEKGSTVLSIVDVNKKAARKLANSVNCKQVSTDVSDIDPKTQIIFITIPDDQIAITAQKISSVKNLNFKKLTVIHTSGVYTSEILSPLAKKGASVFSFHPIQSFPANQSIRDLKKSLKGIYFGVEGNKKIHHISQELVKTFRGKSVFISKKDKPLYHLACVFASNYIVTALNALSEAVEKFKFKSGWIDVFTPIINTSMKNVFTTSPLVALTGPIERGDIKTIELHLKSLAAIAPHLITYYIGMGIETARLARQKRTITNEHFLELINLFKSFLKNK